MAAPASTPQSRAALFRRVYSEAQSSVRQLLNPLIATLEQMGCRDRDFEKFEDSVREVLRGFAYDPPTSKQFTALQINPTPAARQELIQGFLFSLGLDEDQAKSTAQRVMRMPEEHIAERGSFRPGRVSRNSPQGRRRTLLFDLRRLFSEARSLYDRLVDLRKDVNEPYEGNIPRNAGAHWWSKDASDYVDDGVEQTVELLKLFPALADGIYQRSGITGIKGFPPQKTGGPLRGDTAEFVNQVESNLASERTWSIIGTIGLIAGCIALTVATGGLAAAAFGTTAGALVGTGVGAGIGVAQGGYNVYDAQSRLTHAQDNLRFGAGSEQRVAFLEGEVQGAWGMLLVDVVTGGVLGRFGGAGNVGRVLQVVRTTAISGAGAGIGTATNPNVWRSENTVGILLKATVVGMVAGSAGDVVGGALSRAGNRVMLGISRQQGKLQVGSKVTLAARESSAAIEGQVTSISGSRVRVKTAQGEIEFNVNDAAIVSADGSVPTGGTNKPTETPGSATAATAARPRNVAAWVESKAAVGLQRAVDAGPNRWGALPNRPKGARFQRGLSGDYASGSGGMEEAKKLLSGAPDTQMRTVSRMGENVPPGKTTQEVTAIYSDPMSIRGRSDRIDPTLGRDPDREALIPNLSINDVEAIGFFPNRGDALGWSNNYVRLLQQTNVTPTAGTRGAQFLDELQATLATARYETNDFGRYFANADELNQKLNALFIKYGSRVSE